MQRLTRLIVLFSILYAVLIISPAFLSRQFTFYPLMKVGDVTDILTPLILIPIYWLLFQIDKTKSFSAREIIVFMALAALWVEGQGMHLSSNSIGHLLKQVKDSDAYALTNFYDEILSHFLWHVGAIGLSVLLIARQIRNPFVGERASLRLSRDHRRDRNVKDRANGQ